MRKNDLTYIHDLLTRLDDRLDGMDEKLHSLDKTAALQQASLEEHIRRTNLLEQTLEPIKQNHDTVIKTSTTVGKFIGFIAIIVGIWAAVREWFSHG